MSAPKNSQFFDLLAVAVAQGMTVKAAAEEIGCSADYAYELSRKKEFKLRVNELRSEVAEQASGLLMAAASEAIQSLRAIASAAEKDSDRIAAAKAILQMMLPLSENTELRRRLDDIERGVAEATDTA